MPKYIKIDWTEIEELIKKTYNLKTVMLMIRNAYEKDTEHYRYPDYVEGEVNA